MSAPRRIAGSTTSHSAHAWNARFSVTRCAPFGEWSQRSRDRPITVWALLTGILTRIPCHLDCRNEIRKWSLFRSNTRPLLRVTDSRHESSFLVCNARAPWIGAPRARGSLYVSGVFPANGCSKQFAKRVDAKFLLCACAVSLHSFQTQMQILGNLRGSAPLAEEPEYFQLAVT